MKAGACKAKLRSRILVVVGLLLLGVTTWIALAFLRQPPLFQFLDGKEPTQLEQRDILRDLGIDPDTTSFYTFQGDYAAIRRQMREELVAHGYREDPEPGIDETVFAKGDMQVRLYQGRLRTGDPTSVMSLILGSVSDVRDEGWVTIMCKGSERTTLWDRIKTLIGF